jgi:hypothetical protein
VQETTTSRITARSWSCGDQINPFAQHFIHVVCGSPTTGLTSAPDAGSLSFEVTGGHHCCCPDHNFVMTKSGAWRGPLEDKKDKFRRDEISVFVMTNS